MFASFFPRPKILFPAALLWTALSMAIWFAFGADLGPTFSIGGLVGYGYPAAIAVDADDLQMLAFDEAHQIALDIWLYQYMIVSGAIFAALVAKLLPHRWFWWSVVVSSIIVFATWFQVQLDVMINNWFGTFYDMVQQALAEPGVVTLPEFYGQLLTFGGIALVYITTAVVTRFVVSH